MLWFDLEEDFGGIFVDGDRLDLDNSLTSSSSACGNLRCSAGIPLIVRTSPMNVSVLCGSVSSATSLLYAESFAGATV